jgi:hypothetical protein
MYKIKRLKINVKMIKALTILNSRNLLFAPVGIKSIIFNSLLKLYINIIFLYQTTYEMFLNKIAYDGKD